jgi:hypothetical protein
MKISKPIGNVPLTGHVTILQGVYADEGHVIPAVEVNVPALPLMKALESMFDIAKGDLS